MAVPELGQEARFQGPPCSEGLKPGRHVAREGTRLGACLGVYLLTVHLHRVLENRDGWLKVEGQAHVGPRSPGLSRWERSPLSSQGKLGCI